MIPSPTPNDKLNGAFFQYDLPANVWSEFAADGFAAPVTGVVYRTATPVRGVPLGGIGTGFMHLGPDGLLDRATAFNTFLALSGTTIAREDMPAYEQPLLGLAVDERVWILALAKGQISKGFEALTDRTSLEGYASSFENVEYANELHYWGHYPVVDMEYETTAPVRVGARIWTPFLPGDEQASNTPGIVIEARVRNTSDRAQSGSVILNFPGFSESEALLGFRGSQMGLRGSTAYPHHELQGGPNGVNVHHAMEHYENQVGYAMAVITQKPSRIGRDLGHNLAAWSGVGSHLPAFEPCEPGTSMAVDFELESGQVHTVRFILSWFAPFWQARHGYVPKRVAGTNPYTHKYYDRFGSEVEVAQYLAANHQELLRRILRWQQAIHSCRELPGWLRDSLINIFHIIPQNSFWVVSRVPDHWAGADGLFSMNESLPSCPQQQCIPCDFIGNFPLLFFFPNLVEQSIRAFTVRQKASGEVPFIMGSGTELDDACYATQYSTDCQVYVHLVARLWQRTGDQNVLSKYYPAVKKAMRFLESADQDGDGLVDVWGGSWFYEGFPLKGASVFVGGLWLSTLRLAGLMAGEMHDDIFADECRVWLDQGRDTLEQMLWNEKTGAYLLYHQAATGLRSEVILSDQLVGEWAAHFHGLEGIFSPQRRKRAQETVWKINVAGCEVGARATMHPNRSPYQDGYVAAYATLTPAMLELYGGDADRGLELTRRMWHHITCCKGWTWDHPSHYRANGDRMVGHDYYHNTMLWALPAAILKQDLATFCASGGIVDRIIEAARS